MSSIKKYHRSFSRVYKYLISFVLVAGLLYMPDMLTGKISLPGISQIVSAASDPVIAAAGDIACDPSTSAFNNGLGNPNACRQKYTSDLLVNAGLAAVLDLGDNQYYCGGYQAYVQAYDPSWGRVKAITHPSVGNHEYLTSGGTDCSASNAGAAGYFQYFGAAAGTPGQGYYSFDIGAWHIIALNTNCGNAGGCGSTSPQYKWLQADLAAHPNLCTLAYWHIPLYSSGGRANNNSLALWQLLYNNNADLILNGHDHIYERFAPQNASGGVDQVRGMREFVVGTGGADHTSLTTIAANSEVRDTSTFGVLMLTLHADSYDWQFVPEAGKTFTDSGTQACHGSVPNTPTPTATPSQVSTSSSTLSVTGTFTATPIFTATKTSTPTLAATNIPTQTSTSTPIATNPPTPTPTIGTASVTFAPVADTYVDSGNPTTTHGSATTIRLDGSPDIHAYLRFIVSGLSGVTITRVRLLLFANNIDSKGIQAFAVADNAWSELATNYNTAPALGSLLVSSSSFPIGWVTLDVTSYVAGNGTYSLGVTNLSSTAISMASRESGANSPQLIIDYQ